MEPGPPKPKQLALLPGGNVLTGILGARCEPLRPGGRRAEEGDTEEERVQRSQRGRAGGARIGRQVREDLKAARLFSDGLRLGGAAS